jgi:flagellar biosynthetic protein FliR
MDNTNHAILALGSHLTPFLMTLCRIAGIFLIAPVVSSSMAPAKYRAIFAAMIALAVYPTLLPIVKAQAAPFDIIAAVPYLIRETFIGFAMGIIAIIPLLSLEMSGAMSGHQMGLGLSQVYNPGSDAESDVLGQMLYTLAIGAYITCGGVDMLFGCILDSFRTIPIGSLDASKLPLGLLGETLTQGIDLAIRVTAPVSGAVILLTIMLGVIGKTMPQINIMTVGFTLKILAGLFALFFSIYTIADAAGDSMHDTLGRISSWMSIASAGGQADVR